MNDVRINKKIGKFLGEPKKKNVDRSYTHSEIKSLLDIADLRFKVIISVLASTGARIGSLNLKLEKKDDVYKFTLYENTNDEYFTFCSPECATYIDSYLEYRTRSGEKLTKESFLIREQFGERRVWRGWQSRYGFRSSTSNSKEIFIDEFKAAHAAVMINDRLEVLPIADERFKNWLSKNYQERLQDDCKCFGH
jgi:integrase